jgi:hypothetical protein
MMTVIPIFSHHFRCQTLPTEDSVTQYAAKFKYLGCDIPCILDITRVIKSRRIRFGAGDVKYAGRRNGAYMVLVGKPEGKKPRERPRRRW